MKSFFFKSAFLVLSTLLFSHPIYSQHDFDTLYKHDANFKQIAKSLIDTLDIFSVEKPIEVTLESDFKNLIKQKYKDEYQEALFRYHFNDTVIVNRKIKIKPRGNFRRKNCQFPPIKLNFPKGAEKIKQLEEFDKMKMVVDCRRSKTYEQWLLIEYLTYKLYNLFTKYSYRVRLMKVKYIDTSDKYKEADQYAFLIESTDQLASRLNCIEQETKNIRDTYMEQEIIMNMYIFQYLIGNTDWSVPGLHNIKMMQSLDPAKKVPVAVPYDFDYSGIVNASYAIPHELIGVETVRERKYWGYCRSREDVDKAVQLFNSSKEEIYHLFNEAGLLEKKTLSGTISYLDEFYKTINNESSLKRYIVEDCRK